jgi:hypothetical protein
MDCNFTVFSTLLVGHSVKLNEKCLSISWSLAKIKWRNVLKLSV